MINYKLLKTIILGHNIAGSKPIQLPEIVVTANKKEKHEKDFINFKCVTCMSLCIQNTYKSNYY